MTDDTVSIGELSRRTGVPVRTIRFYCDNGILASVRSGGGHRMFDEGTAVDRLVLVRRLRALGLGLVAITGVLTGERSMTEVLAVERAAVDAELDALAWRRASLRAIEIAAPPDRVARLALLAAAQDGSAAHDALVGFWRRILGPIPSEMFDNFVGMNVPEPPRDPAPETVAGYAELVTFVTDRQFSTAVSQQLWRPSKYPIRDKAELIAGVGEACGMAESQIGAGIEPRSGTALDRFVGAHAAARGTRDTPGFRESLRTGRYDDDQRTHRYWRLTGEISGTATTAGAGQRWLSEALQQI